MGTGMNRCRRGRGWSSCGPHGVQASAVLYGCQACRLSDYYNDALQEEICNQCAGRCWCAFFVFNVSCSHTKSAMTSHPRSSEGFSSDESRVHLHSIPGDMRGKGWSFHTVSLGRSIISLGKCESRQFQP